MNVLRPEFLFLLVVPAALAAAAVLGKGAVVGAPVPDGGAVRSRRLPGFALILPGLLPPALLAVFIVIAAGPVRMEQAMARVPKQMTNIQFCLDVSNSMLATRIGAHCRYCAAAKVIGEFARAREGDAFGLTLFGTVPIVWLPLTEDVSALYRAAELCYPDYMPKMVNRYSDIASGVRVSVDQLTSRSTPRGERLLILLTDGEDPALQQQETELSSLFQEQDITLYVLVFQNAGRTPQLARLAESSRDGRLFDCATTQELGEAFRQIDSMKKIEYEVLAPQPQSHTRPWLIAGFAIAGTYVLSLFYLRFTPW